MNKNIDNTSGLLNWNDRKQAGGRIIYLVMFILLLALSLVCLLPVLWMALSSFKTTQEMYAVPPTLFPKSIDPGRIVTIWNSSSIGHYALNSLWIIIGCLTFDIIFNGLAGYVLSRVRPLGSTLINTVLFWTMMLPGISMVPLYMTFVDLPVLHINMTGTFAPLWIMAMSNAFNIFLFRNFFLFWATEFFAHIFAAIPAFLSDSKAAAPHSSRCQFFRIITCRKKILHKSTKREKISALFFLVTILFQLVVQASFADSQLRGSFSLISVISL